jgi:hypothetical protein
VHRFGGKGTATLMQSPNAHSSADFPPKMKSAPKAMGPPRRTKTYNEPHFPAGKLTKKIAHPITFLPQITAFIMFPNGPSAPTIQGCDRFQSDVDLAFALPHLFHKTKKSSPILEVNVALAFASRADGRKNVIEFLKASGKLDHEGRLKPYAELNELMKDLYEKMAPADAGTTSDSFGALQECVLVGRKLFAVWRGLHKHDPPGEDLENMWAWVLQHCGQKATMFAFHRVASSFSRAAAAAGSDVSKAAIGVPRAKKRRREGDESPPRSSSPDACATKPMNA